MKDKFKSYSFWMSLTAAIVLVLNNVGKVVGFVVDGSAISQIVDSVCGVLILLGVITMTKENPKTDDEEKTDDETENKEK